MKSIAKKVQISPTCSPKNSKFERWYLGLRVGTWQRAAGTVLGSLAMLVGCAGVLPEAPQRAAVYDLGSPSGNPSPASPSRKLVLAPVEAPAALGGPAMLYRLSHTQALELRPYALARWSMSPAALVRERAAAALAREHTVLTVGDPLQAGALTLKLELLRFEQVFTSDTASTADVAVRATLFGADGQPRAQRSFARSTDAGANAASGAAGMRASLDFVLQEISAWLRANAL